MIKETYIAKKNLLFPPNLQKHNVQQFHFPPFLIKKIEKTFSRYCKAWAEKSL